MTLFSYYRDILGRPNQGVHKHYMGVAVMDVLGTLAFVGAVSYAYELNTKQTVMLGGGMFALGVITHYLFGVNTTVNNLLGLGSKVNSNMGGVKFQ